MRKQPAPPAPEADTDPTFSIALEKVCWLIMKTREFDAKDVSTDADTGSNPTDDNMMSVLEDRRDDPVEQELRAFIEQLTEDEQIDLVALAWLGRDGGTIDEWPTLRAEASRSHANHPRHTSNYLLGDPLVSDFLSEGLALFGKSCEDADIDHL